MRKPNSARLGTVCMMLAKPRIGLLSAGLRVSRMPSGTPIRTAMPVEMTTRNRCSKTSSASSPRLCAKNSSSVTPVSRSLGRRESRRRRRAPRDGTIRAARRAAPSKTISPSLSSADAVAEHESFGDIVGDEHHGLAELLLQGFELLLNIAPGDRIEGAEWFVQENHRRIGGQRPGDADALALAAGKFAREARGESGRRRDRPESTARAPAGEFAPAPNPPAAAPRRYFVRWSDAGTGRSPGSHNRCAGAAGSDPNPPSACRRRSLGPRSDRSSG